MTDGVERSLVVVGSVALDTVETPAERREDLLGGSATYFAYAASFFAPVRVVGVVGEDFPSAGLDLLRERDVDLAGLVRKPGRTFRWAGRYDQSMNDRVTTSLELNVLGEYAPEVPAAFRDSRYVFLATSPPQTQIAVLDQMPQARLAVADTINLYISTARDGLLALLARVDGLVVNDSEARLLTGETSLVRAAQAIRRLGPRFVVIKKGEHGVLLADEAGVSALPAFPVGALVDPTGAGDTFAGAMMGRLARAGSAAEPDDLRLAVAYGIIVAAYEVEDFSLDRLRRLTLADIEKRLTEYRAMLAV
jgi:sugar/nucleoside kinase (ribokinase family)